MKLLLLTPGLPHPPHKGTSIRNLAILRQAAGTHQVHLLSFAAGEPSPASLTVLRGLTSGLDLVPPPPRGRVVRSVDLALSSRPDLVRRLASRRFADRLVALLERERPEVIQMEGLELAGYLPLIRRTLRCGVVLDEHNCEYCLQETLAAGDRGGASPLRSAYSRIQARRLRGFERWACDAADAVTAVSEGDAEGLRALGVDVPITVIPNGVTLPPPAVRQPEHPPLVLFAGTLDYRPNVDAARWLARDIWPLVQVPGARLAIVGRSPLPSVRELAGPGVEVVADVPSMTSWYARASAVVVPLRAGSGTRLKVLEAMAARVPVVATSVGMAGLASVPGADHLRADDATGLAAALTETISDPDAAARRSAAAYDLVQGYEWDRLLPRFLPIWERVAAGASDD